MANELTTPNFSAEDLARMAGYAKADNDGVGRNNLPALKINYDENSKYERGAWVLGQKKSKNDKGEEIITEEGTLVEKFIVLKVRNMYNMFPDPKKNPGIENCKSPIFKDFEKGVRGNKYHYVCTSGECPYRQENAPCKCKGQKLVFGIAVTDDGMKDCVMYIKGDSYMPFVEFYKNLPNAEVNKQKFSLPVYAFINKITSEKKKNGTVTYYVAKFEKNSILSTADIDKLHDKAVNLEEDLDKSKSAYSADDEESTTTTPAAAVEVKAAVVVDPKVEEKVSRSLFSDN